MMILRRLSEQPKKALSLLSANVNVGIESVMYVQEYKITKEKIFIETQKQTGSGS